MEQVLRSRFFATPFRLPKSNVLCHLKMKCCILMKVIFDSCNCYVVSFCVIFPDFLLVEDYFIGPPTHEAVSPSFVIELTKK